MKSPAGDSPAGRSPAGKSPAGSSPAGSAPEGSSPAGSAPPGARVGLGFDVHRLVAGRRCVLGGVEIPHPAGPAGHSDGDAVLHAVCDALLGAAGLDDLGSLFPDTDPAWKGADSARLLASVVERVRAAGFAVVNVDVVIATEGPRIAPHRAAMRARIAALCGVGPEAVNVKGKTLEGLGALADGRGIAAQAICLLANARTPAAR